MRLPSSKASAEPLGRKAIEDRHRREQRQVRTDELRAGLATLASAYRSRLGDREPAGAPGGLARRSV